MTVYSQTPDLSALVRQSAVKAIALMAHIDMGQCILVEYCDGCVCEIFDNGKCERQSYFALDGNLEDIVSRKITSAWVQDAYWIDTDRYQYQVVYFIIECEDGKVTFEVHNDMHGGLSGVSLEVSMMHPKPEAT